MEDLSLNRADEINRLHSEVIGHAKTSIETAIRIGELLTEQKAGCAHGEWLPWLEQNTKINRKTAHRYMGCYEHRDRLKCLPGETFEAPTIKELARKDGKPRGAHKAPQEHASAPIVNDLADKGFTYKQIAAQTGVSEFVVRNIVEEEAIRREERAAGREIDPNTLKVSDQKKLARAVTQELKNLQDEYAVKLHKAVGEYLVDISVKYQQQLNYSKRIIESRQGFMTKVAYKRILSCLHPDWVTDEAQKERYAAAFREFTDLAKYVLAEKDQPTSFAPPLPKTPAEWEEARRKASEARKAKRAAGGGSVAKT